MREVIKRIYENVSLPANYDRYYDHNVAISVFFVNDDDVEESVSCSFADLYLDCLILELTEGFGDIRHITKTYVDGKGRIVATVITFIWNGENKNFMRKVYSRKVST